MPPSADLSVPAIALKIVLVKIDDAEKYDLCVNMILNVTDMLVALC